MKYLTLLIAFVTCVFAISGCEDVSKVRESSKSDLPEGFGKEYINQHPIERTYINVLNGKYFLPADKNEADLYYAAHHLKNVIISDGFNLKVKHAADSIMLASETTSASKVVKQVVTQVLLNSYLHYGFTSKDIPEIERCYRILIENGGVNFELLYKTGNILRKNNVNAYHSYYIREYKSDSIAFSYISYWSSELNNSSSEVNRSIAVEDSLDKEVYSIMRARTLQNVESAKMWLKEIK